MEHAAAWVSHVPLSWLDYITHRQVVQLRLEGKKRNEEVRFGVCPGSLSHMNTHTHAETYTHLHAACQSSQSVIKVDVIRLKICQPGRLIYH